MAKRTRTPRLPDRARIRVAGRRRPGDAAAVDPEDDVGIVTRTKAGRYCVEVQLVSGDPLHALWQLATLERELRPLEYSLVAMAREERSTWRELGEALGMSAQAVQERYGPAVKELLAGGGSRTVTTTRSSR